MATAQEGIEPRPGIATATAKRRRRRLTRRQRRTLVLLAGAVIGVGSLTGFILSARALDERIEVVVADVRIEAGQTVTVGHLTSHLAHPGSIPHLPWSDVSDLDGLVAPYPIPRGSLVTPAMLLVPGVLPVGAELLLEVPLDFSLAPDGVNNGDLVLLIDPGAEPTGAEGGDGRPARVVRSIEIENLVETEMTLFLEPEPWAERRAEIEAAGGRLQVVRVPLGGDPDELKRRLDAVWADEWSQAVEAARSAREDEQGPQPGPGELEVAVSLDERLASSGVSEGDRVLLIDPGQAPNEIHMGRPRMVLRPLELDDYEDGRVRLFVPPEEWVWWSGLVDSLGGHPLVLPVAEGTDVNDLAVRLDEQWRVEWELRVDEITRSDTAGLR